MKLEVETSLVTVGGTFVEQGCSAVALIAINARLSIV